MGSLSSAYAFHAPARQPSLQRFAEPQPAEQAMAGARRANIIF
jgi:hypothetical protein